MTPRDGDRIITYSQWGPAPYFAIHTSRWPQRSWAATRLTCAVLRLDYTSLHAGWTHSFGAWAINRRQ